MLHILTDFSVFLGTIALLCLAGAVCGYFENKIATRKRNKEELVRLGKKWYGWEPCEHCGGSGRIQHSLSNDPLYRCDVCEGFGSVGLRDFRRKMEEMGKTYRSAHQ